MAQSDPPQARLIIVGSGATAEQLAALGSQLGYHELRLVDSVPADVASTDHLVIAEEEPRVGQHLLLAAAQKEVMPAYLGFAAPREEGLRALVILAEQQVPQSRLDLVSAPAGVDVGAQTPPEVAIAVAAELVAVRRGRPPPSQGLPIDPDE